MPIECQKCGVTHASKQEATATHLATASVRKWLRQVVKLSIIPMAVGKKTTRKLGDNALGVVDRKRGSKGYNGPLPPEERRS